MAIQRGGAFDATSSNRGWALKMRTTPIVASAQSAISEVNGRRVVNLASNNYLGLAADERVRRAAIAAIAEYGAGTASVRPIAGNMTLHLELEERLAAFKKVEAVLLCQSGYAANLGAVSGLFGRGDLVVSDELNHASIIDGARLSRADVRVYPHADVNGAREAIALDQPRAARPTLIITDGVFSMDGDIAPLDKLADLAESVGAFLAVDDAHAVGVLGANGRGSVDHFDLHSRVEFQVGTLSKAFGIMGGYVGGSRDLIERLRDVSRPHLFSTSPPPPVVAACLEGLKIIEEEPDRIQTLHENTRYFQTGLRKLDFTVGESSTPITPIYVGSAADTDDFCIDLLQNGVFVTALRYPTVPKGKSRLRAIVSGLHSREDLDAALTAFGEVRNRMQKIQNQATDVG